MILVPICYKCNTNMVRIYYQCGKSGASLRHVCGKSGASVVSRAEPVFRGARVSRGKQGGPRQDARRGGESCEGCAGRAARDAGNSGRYRQLSRCRNGQEAEKERFSCDPCQACVLVDLVRVSMSLGVWWESGNLGAWESRSLLGVCWESGRLGGWESGSLLGVWESGSLGVWESAGSLLGVWEQC